MIAKYIRGCLVLAAVASLAYYFAVYKPSVEKRIWHELGRIYAKHESIDSGSLPAYSIVYTDELKHGVLLVNSKDTALVYLGSLTPDHQLYLYPENENLDDCIALRDFVRNKDFRDNVKELLFDICNKK